MGYFTYVGIDVVADDAAEKLYVSAFPCGVPRPSAVNYLTIELTAL